MEVVRVVAIVVGFLLIASTAMLGLALWASQFLPGPEDQPAPKADGLHSKKVS